MVYDFIKTHQTDFWSKFEFIL